MALKQGQQILLVQAEFLRQQVAAARKDRHALGPRFPQAVAVGAGDIGSEIMAVVLDNAHFPPPAAQGRQKLFQQRRLAAVRLADQRHPNKMLFQLHQKFVRQLYRNRPCNAQVQPLHLLQNRLAVAIHIASCHTHPAAGGCGQKSMRKLRLVCKISSI